MQKPLSVSLVIPMFNEEENIEHAIGCAAAALERCTQDWEIVVVDDASLDSCPRIVEQLAQEEPRIRLLRHAVNRKLGATLKTGYGAALKDVVVYMDADLPFDPEVIGRAIQALRVTRADLIAGYRLDRTTEGFRRTVYSYLYNSLIGILFGWPHRDINFSFKLMRREVLEAVELQVRRLADRRRADREGAQPRVRHPAARAGLLPPHPWALDAVVPGGDPQDLPGARRRFIPRCGSRTGKPKGRLRPPPCRPRCRAIEPARRHGG